MPTFARLPIRTEALKWAFALYAGCSLISMATMSVGAVFLATLLMLTAKSSEDLWNEFKSLTQSKGNPLRTYLILSLALTLACAFSLIWGQWAPLQYGGRGVKINFFQDMAKIWYLYWPWLLLVGFKRLDDRQRFFVFKSWILAFAILSTLGILQYFTGWPRVQTIPNGEVNGQARYHATLFLGHHLSVASILIFPFFAILDYSQSRRLKIPRPILWAAAGVGLLTLLLTFSRTLWIGLPLGMLLWIGLKIPRQKRWNAILCMSAGLVLLAQYQPLRNRIHDGMGLGQRKDLWQANWAFFQERPLTGVGWRTNQTLSGYYLMEKYHTTDVFSGHAHNNFLDMLGGTGLLGAITWLLWCGWVFYILFRAKAQPNSSVTPNFSMGLACAWFVFHVNGLTQVNFWEAKVQHQMAWVIAWSLWWATK